METRICRLHGQGDIRIETQIVAAPGPGEALVAIAVGGICGSDLHYYQDGGFGPIRVREPIILGHEASGTVLDIGAGVDNLKPGLRVAINPSRPCGDCVYCRQNLPVHCLKMRFNGSALRYPHEQGLFRDRIIVDASQCVPLDSGTTFAEAACAEPLAVCLHARRMAGPIRGKRVLVTGAGPIGALCTAIAVKSGAEEVVVTDLHDFTLEVALRMGASRAINAYTAAGDLDLYAADKGTFDVAFECSAAASAINTAATTLRPRGKLIQVGVAGDTPVPVNLLVGKEITFQGTHRFDVEFNEAVRMISSRELDVRPIVSKSYSLDKAFDAFEAAGDRSRSVKVQIVFQPIDFRERPDGPTNRPQVR